MADFKFLVLDGETPSDWKPFTLPMIAFMKEAQRRGITEALPPSRREDQKLRFMPIYAGKSGWKKIGNVGDVVGFIIDASFPHGKEELTALLYDVSQQWSGNTEALCRKLGFAFLWFVRRTPMTRQEVMDLQASFTATIRDGLSVGKFPVLPASLSSEAELEAMIDYSV